MKTSLAILPLIAFLSGCHSQPLPPANLRAQFVQAVTSQDTRTMAHLLAQPNGYSSIQPQAAYDTPESEKDPTLRGETLAMWALRTGRFEAAQTLLPLTGATVNDFGRTPLMYIALYAPEVGPYQNIINLVLSSSNVQLSAVDNNGDSALFLALRRGALGTTTQLLQAGAPISTHHVPIRNKQGQTALDLAIASKNKALIALITQVASGHKIHTINPATGR